MRTRFLRLFGNSEQLSLQQPAKRFTSQRSSRPSSLQNGSHVAPRHSDDEFVISVPPPRSNSLQKQRSHSLSTPSLNSSVPRSPMPSVQESLWNSRRRSVDSVKEEGGVLSPVRSRQPNNFYAPTAPLSRNASTATKRSRHRRNDTAETAALSRKASTATKRSGHQRNGTATSGGGIRIQTDIMVVEEALNELAAQHELAAEAELDMFEAERGGKKSLPKLPGVVKDAKPLPDLPDAVHKRY